jgi:hypothetical protein
MMSSPAYKLVPSNAVPLGERLLRVLNRQLDRACELVCPVEIEDTIFLSTIYMDELTLLFQEGAVPADQFNSASEVYIQLHMALHQQCAALAGDLDWYLK